MSLSISEWVEGVSNVFKRTVGEAHEFVTYGFIAGFTSQPEWDRTGHENTNKAGAFVCGRMSRTIQEVWKDPGDDTAYQDFLEIFRSPVEPHKYEVAARPHMCPNFKLQPLLSFSLHII